MKITQSFTKIVYKYKMSTGEMADGYVMAPRGYITEMKRQLKECGCKSIKTAK